MLTGASGDKNNESTGGNGVHKDERDGRIKKKSVRFEKTLRI